MTRRTCIFFLVLLLAVSCGREVLPIVQEAPQVRFSREESALTAVVGEKVTLSATLVAGDKVTMCWYVDGVLESSSSLFEYVFDVRGDHSIRFVAHNGTAEINKDYTVSVSDIFRMHLSVGDSLVVPRIQARVLKFLAVVDYGSDVTHEWKVDGVVESTAALFNNFTPMEVRDYTISYHGENPAGFFDKTFTVRVSEAPLTVRYSIADPVINTVSGKAFTLTATAVYGADGLQSKWLLVGQGEMPESDLVIGTDHTLDYNFPLPGEYTLRYEGVNAKGETAGRDWTVKVSASGHLADDFEDGLKNWWANRNSPGITVVDNPFKAGLNVSDKVLSDAVAGTGSTSGYFDLNLSSIADAAGVDITKCNGVRFKVYLGAALYYPRVEYGSVKYASLSAPVRGGKWEYLEYRFPKNLERGKTMTLRPMLKEDGSNIDAGEVSEQNPRQVYIDDFEFLDSNL